MSSQRSVLLANGALPWGAQLVRMWPLVTQLYDVLRPTLDDLDSSVQEFREQSKGGLNHDEAKGESERHANDILLLIEALFVLVGVVLLEVVRGRDFHRARAFVDLMQKGDLDESAKEIMNSPVGVHLNMTVLRVLTLTLRSGGIKRAEEVDSMISEHTKESGLTWLSL